MSPDLTLVRVAYILLGTITYPLPAGTNVASMILFLSRLVGYVIVPWRVNRERGKLTTKSLDSQKSTFAPLALPGQVLEAAPLRQAGLVNVALKKFPRNFENPRPKIQDPAHA